MGNLLDSYLRRSPSDHRFASGREPAMILRSLVIMVGAFSAASAMAADLPKEGTFKGTYTAVGTYKQIKIGDRSLINIDDMGLQITNGFADRMTVHCWGTEEITNGETAGAGYCVAMDPTGV